MDNFWAVVAAVSLIVFLIYLFVMSAPFGADIFHLKSTDNLPPSYGFPEFTLDDAPKYHWSDVITHSSYQFVSTSERLKIAEDALGDQTVKNVRDAIESSSLSLHEPGLSSRSFEYAPHQCDFCRAMLIPSKSACPSCAAPNRFYREQ